MKKNVLSILLFFYIIKIIAQPQLTTTILPISGDTIQLSVDTLLRPAGAAGANVSWNFTQINSDFITKRIYKLASATPYASSYPSATLARTDANGFLYTYWKNSSTNSIYYGFVQPGIVDQNYNTLPINYYKFPIKYNDAFTDSFSATTNPGSIVGAGKYSFKADAWGTLKLPKIIVTNTLRTKSVLYIGDSSINSYSLTTEYAWYVNGQKDPLLVISSVVVNGKLSQKITLFYNSPLLGIKAINFTESLKVFPNPAQSTLTVNCDYPETGETVFIKVFDVLGRLHYLSEINADSNQCELDISDYPSGCYIVEVTMLNKILHQKFTKD